MNVKDIFNADIYRDGGSYGFCFHSDNGSWYEFFIQRDLRRVSGNDYLPPKIYLEGCNSKNVISELSWEQGQEFIRQLNYNNDRFAELVAIVNANGRLNENT